ncbi:MAG TPA: glycosyltransferase [Candidatus Acidoferrales bacterium]|nr:glycosyltransferase [Candidatus Acidoferrales bacterium]
MFEELPKPPKGWPQRQAGISLCMIVRDEERFLEEALASVEGVVDEICIVDTGSKDGTLDIARRAGARVREVVWENDFSKARNAALAMAARRWVLVLDADERLSPRSREFVRALGSHEAHLTGLWTRIYNFTDDYKGTGAMSNVLVRFFPNNERIRYRNPIHEFIALDGNETGMPAQTSPIEIVHFGYRNDVMVERKKHERNMQIAERALRDGPDDAVNWYNYATAAMLAESTTVAISALERMRELARDRLRARGDDRIQSFVPNGLCLLAGLYLKNSAGIEKAIASIEEALKYAPGLADAHFILGKCFVAQRRFAEAREAYVAAIEDGKEAHRQPLVDNEVFLWKAQSEIGSTLMEEGGYELALKWFDLALSVRPKVQPVRLNRARSLEQLGRFDEAESAFVEVWKDDRDAVAANDYVNYLLRRARNEDALDFIERETPHLPPESQLIMYGSAAAVASRSGLSGVERYLNLAWSVEGVDEPAARLHSLLRHFGDSATLALLERKMEA